MELRIKGLRLEFPLLLPLFCMLIGFVFVGRFLRVLAVDTGSRGLWLPLIVLALAGIWALPLSLGGLLGSVVAIAIAFFRGGIVPAAIATAVAGVVIGLGLWQSSPEPVATPRRPLTWVEWAATGVTAALAGAIAYGATSSTIGIIGGLATGAAAGAVCTLGPQLRESELSPRQIQIMLLAIVVAGISVGLLVGLLTYTTTFPT